MLAIEGPKVIHTERETWLMEAVEALRPIFAEAGAEIPALRVSVGFPGGNGSKAGVIGQCFPTGLAKDKVANLFISPVLEDRETVLATLAHEIVHAVDDCKSGHKAPFARLAKAIGLRGKMTATHAGPELAQRLNQIAAELGVYPHGAVRNPGPKSKGRMMRMHCPECGFIAYTSQKWLDEYGAAICPCNEKFMRQG